MRDAQPGTLLRHIHGLVPPPQADGLTDAELLAGFVRDGDEAAFAALIQRHGGLVWGVCRHLLRQEQDAEDAFQATFLALARRAGTIRKSESLSSWLHGTAYRVAMRAKRDAARRQARERRAVAPEPPSAEWSWRELQAALDEEVQALPPRQRDVFVLSRREGKSGAEAAAALGWKEGTVSGTLARARRLLRARLARRGVALSALLTGLALVGAGARAAPPSLASAALRAALGNSVSPHVAALAKGATASMIPTRAKLALVLLLAGALTAGAAVARHAAVPAAVPVVQGEQDEPRRQPKEAERPDDELPAGALVRLGTVRLRHGQPVCGLAYAPGGKQLVSVGGDGVARLWDAATGREVRTFRCAPDSVFRAVAFAPDGKTFATAETVGADAVVRVWDPETGREVSRFESRRAWVYALAYSPDGKALAAGARGDLVLLDPTTGKEQFRAEAQKRDILALAFFPDGKKVASAGVSGTVRFTDAATGKETQSLEAQREEIWGLAISPDGKVVASWGPVREGVQLWDAATGRGIARRAGGQRVASAAYSPDGKQFATGGADGRVRVWDAATYRDLRTFDEIRGRVAAVAFSLDGKTVAWACGTAVALNDAATGADVVPPGGHREPIWSASLSPDGRLAATADSRGVRLWDAATGTELRRCADHPGFAACVAFSPDGKVLATAAWDGTVRLYDPATGEELRRYKGHAAAPHRLAWSADGTRLVSASFDGSVRVWDAATAEEVSRLSGAMQEFRAVAVSPDGALVATCGPGDAATLWDAATGKRVRAVGHGLSNVHAVAFSPDGRLLACAASDNYFLAGWQDNTTSPWRRLQGPAVTLWDVATGKEVRTLGAALGGAQDLAFSADGRTLAVAGEDGRLWLFEVASGGERQSLAGHRGPLTAVALSRDGRVALSAGRDTAALVWDVTGRARDGGLPRVKLTAAALDDRWAELAGDDAKRAHRAQWALVAGAEQSVPYLAERLRPAAATDQRQLARLVAALGADDFEERERAAAALEKLGDEAEAALRKAADHPDAELRRRAKLVLANIPAAVPPPERLRELRAVEVLEQAETAPARKLLERLAEGAPQARLTRDARAALERLNKATKP
jgi:RNA polymerase sigma factor (sigma-70 family)